MLPRASQGSSKTTINASTPQQHQQSHTSGRKDCVADTITAMRRADIVCTGRCMLPLVYYWRFSWMSQRRERRQWMHCIEASQYVVQNTIDPCACHNSIAFVTSWSLHLHKKASCGIRNAHVACVQTIDTIMHWHQKSQELVFWGTSPTYAVQNQASAPNMCDLCLAQGFETWLSKLAHIQVNLRWQGSKLVQ